MKRYLLFTGDTFYPGGGMKDFRGDFNTIDEAFDFSASDKVGAWDWYEIYDTHERKDATPVPRTY
jgi:glyoxylase-like metal-dependent hydrolase (beta-lactamase superfamily II)